MAEWWELPPPPPSVLTLEMIERFFEDESRDINRRDPCAEFSDDPYKIRVKLREES